MVAATVAAVASSTVLGPAVAGAASHSSTRETTGSFPTVSVSDSAASAGSAGGVSGASTAAAPNNTGMGGAKAVDYIVQPGDTVHDIAAKYGVSTMAVIHANTLANPDLIFPGDHINVPGDSGTEDIEITVKEGDTINKLAERYGVSASAIIDLASNKITNPDLIIVDQKLTIPGVSSDSVTTNTDGGSSAQATTASLASTNTTDSQPSSSDQKSSQGGGNTQAAAAPQATTQSTPAPTPPPTPPPAPAPTQAPAQPASDGFVWPTQGTITQNFGPTSFGLEPAYMGYAHFHQGLDIANSMYTPIKAAAAGTVIFSGWSNVGYGFCVQIDHGNGVITLYGHMAQQPSVGVGQHVDAGQQIGKMGSTGASTGSHLHFAVKKNGTWVDPKEYLP